MPAPMDATWQRIMAAAVTSPRELLELLDLPPSLLPAAEQAARLFPLRVPRGYLERIQKGDPGDPLLRQVLPLGEELMNAEGFHQDPVGDLAAMPRPGVLHKYQGRVLLVATGACAVHCRYCFRRHFPYPEANAATTAWEEALAYIAADPSITEVILSGGDPLVLNTRRLETLTEQLTEIPHVQRLRLHTRVPVVTPERVDTELTTWMRATRLKVVVVIHANHPRELGEDVRGALARLRAAGITLLNQSVLLKGVNDDAGTLSALSEALFNLGVLPYYLHLLDKVEGAAHFDVDVAQAQTLIRSLRASLPGYLVPRLVSERQGAPSKITLDGDPSSGTLVPANKNDKTRPQPSSTADSRTPPSTGE